MKVSVLMALTGLSMQCIGIPLDVYVVAEDDGSGASLGQAAFEEMLPTVNAIFSQVALSFELRSYNVVSNGEWNVIESRSEFLDVLDACPSTNGVPVYVFREIVGPTSGITICDEGCSIEVGAGAGVLAHELGHMCGLDDIYASADNSDASNPNCISEISAREDEAREEWLPMDWGRYPQGTTQGELIDRMLMNGHCYVNGQYGCDITAGDVYGICIGMSSVTNTTTGEVSHSYVKGMARVGFLLHGNRNPSRGVRP